MSPPQEGQKAGRRLAPKTTFLIGERKMAFIDYHIGNKMGVDVEFPCPDCNNGNMAKGHFKKSDAKKGGYIDVPCACSGGHDFPGDAILHPAGLDVEVHIHDDRIKNSDLQVS
jgi:hypothetical protein